MQYKNNNDRHSIKMIAELHVYYRLLHVHVLGARKLVIIVQLTFHYLHLLLSPEVVAVSCLSFLLSGIPFEINIK